MGNKINSFRSRIIIFIALLASSVFSVVVGFPYAKGALPSYEIAYYHYSPSATVLAAMKKSETTGLPPATAVPILMYHGVVDHVDDVNTTIGNFINDMETLKANGYETISVHELDLFHQGKFTLPPKPIIITFDDGRKDSYYTTDDVLRQLGFKATMFVATGPTIDGNAFYLTFDELKTMKDSGRWEIEAHGRYSHHKIQIDATGVDEGHFLTSRMWLTGENRLETVAEFEQRVEADYLNGINDLKTNVGIETPQYFAIPLNDYGQQALSNYPEAFTFNEKMIRKYFRLAFIQANDNIEPANLIMPLYNFAYSNPYATRRIEVENLTAMQLLAMLNGNKPTSPQLSLDSDNFNSANFNTRQFTGKIVYLPNGLSLTANQVAANGQIIFGQDYWQDYQVTSVVQKVAGRSITLLFNFQDQKDYLAFGRTDNGYFLRETVNGETRDLQPPYQPTNPPPSDVPVTLTVTTKNGLVTCSVNGEVIFSQVATTIQSGATGFKVWGDTVAGSGILQRMLVSKI